MKWLEPRTSTSFPVSGSFTQEDPLGVGSGDLHFYRYVMNMPVMASDPSGNFTIDRSCDLCLNPKTPIYQSQNPVYLQQRIQMAGDWACQALAAGITNPKRKKCVQEYCGGGTIRCADCAKEGHPTAGAYAGAGTATFCLNRLTSDPGPFYLGNSIIHEFAHVCGWRHGGGEGVPDRGDYGDQ